MEQYKLSVIIPTYNRCEILRKCLDALSFQDLKFKDFEVIVSDDGSTDNTKKSMNRIRHSYPFSLSYLLQSNQGANAARNRAIEASHGKILLFINDDVIAEPGMLSEHIKTHEEYLEDRIAVLGKVTISSDIPYSIFSKLHLNASFDIWSSHKILDWRAFYTCNVSVKRSFLLSYGLFDECLRYHEDLELSKRLSQHGLIVIYNQKALGYHYHYLTEKEYLKIAERDGQALAKWSKKSPNLGKELWR